MSATYPAQQSNQQTLADGAQIDWDVALGDSAKVVLGGDRTINNPTNAIAGRPYILELIQDATGGRTPTWGDQFIWPLGVIPTPNPDANGHDIYTFFFTGGFFLGNAVVGYQLP